LPRAVRAILTLAIAALLVPAARAQAGPTARSVTQISTFAAITGTQTGLDSGRNIGFTAGLDLDLLPIYGLHPSIEGRGTLAIDKGHVDSQKNILGGLKLAYPIPRLPRLRPYGTALFGRGSIDYGPTGYQVPQTNIFYEISHTNVLSLGGGIDYKLSGHLFLKLDAQSQRYSTPVTLSHHLYAITANVGLLYRFHFGHPSPEGID
jgi:hypothetical protein